MTEEKMKTEEEELKEKWKSLFINTMGKEKELFKILSYGLEQAELKGRIEATQYFINIGDKCKFIMHEGKEFVNWEELKQKLNEKK